MSLAGKLLVAAAVLGAAVGQPAVAAADDDERREVRKAGICTGSSDSSIRVRADDGEIRIEFEIDTARSTGTWRVILLHERRIVVRAAVASGGSGRSLRLRRTVADWYGRDTITVRASGPRAETCRVSATV